MKRLAGPVIGRFMLVGSLLLPYCAAAADDAATEVERLTQVITLIGNEYVREVPYDQLLTSCARHIDAWTVAHGGRARPKLTPNEPLNQVKAAMLDARSLPSVEGQDSWLDACVEGMVTGLDNRSEYYRGASYQEAISAAHADDEGPLIAVREGVAYVRVVQFFDWTPMLLATRTAQWQSTNVRGLILDLRGNPGGALSASGALAAMFMEQNKMLWRMEGRLPDSNQSVYSSHLNELNQKPALDAAPSWIKKVPMVVLVNGQTAAGAEIVASALQDYRRAAVAGVQTAGIGSIQTVRRIDAGRLVKLTTAQVIRPNGHPLAGSGIVPDKIIPAAAQTSDLQGFDDPVVDEAAKLFMTPSKP